MTEANKHRMDLRVYYEDTDAGGIVYHANYLHFAERARTEMLRAVGIDHRALLEQDGMAFAIRQCNTDYLMPARLDDMLTIVSSIKGIGGASMDVEQIIMRENNILCTLQVRLVCMVVSGDRAGRPARIPDHIRDATATFSATMVA